MVWIMGIMMLMAAKQSAGSEQDRFAEPGAVRIDVGSSHRALKVDGSPVKVSDGPSLGSQASAANQPAMVIPTPVALVAGVLLLLPFALSTLRILDLGRKRSA